MVVKVIQQVTRVVQVVARGPQGPSGDAAEGFPTAIHDPENGDVLIFNGTAWANRPETDLVDGGNY